MTNARIEAGGVGIRPLQRDDIAAAMRLKQAAGWNQTYLDLERFLALEPRGGLAACAGSRVVGTVTTFSFQNVSWIGMMLVEPAWRRRGIATRLMKTTVQRLEERGQAAIWLDATELGAPLYRQLGFEPFAEVIRLGGHASTPPPGDNTVRVRAAGWDDLPAMAALDRQVAGADRTRLLQRLYVEQPNSTRLVSQSGSLDGFVMDRPGSYACLIGPLVARTAAAGRSLLADALARHRGHSVLVDIPAENALARSLAEHAGLTPQRHFTRMVRGRHAVVSWRCLWASSGPEKG